MRKLEEKTGGGLFVPTADTEKPKEGIVVAAGPGKVNAETGELIPSPVAEGDLVLLSDFSGEKVDYNNEKHIFVNADNLLGKFEVRVPSSVVIHVGCAAWRDGSGDSRDPLVLSARAPCAGRTKL